MMSTPGKGASKKEKKKPVPVKTSLNNPYNLHWSPLDKEHKHFILNTLKEKITAVSLQKKRVNTFRDWGNRRKSNKKATEEHKPDPETPSKPDPETPSKPDPETPSKPAEPSWTDTEARKQLAIGINEVTRCLERNELSLVLVCNSVVPSHMTNHLIPLSKTRSVPACQVPRLSESLSGLLGLKCVLALGFKRDAQKFADVVGSIAAVVPPLNVAWVSTDLTPEAVEIKGEAEEEQTDTARGQKRKLEQILGEASEASSPVLQPLKVKKIIPNPTKVRKPKKKGKQK